MNLTNLVRSLAITAFICPSIAFSQTPTLEFTAGAGNPTTATGPVISQTITFQNNTDNPTGNTFAAFSSPTTTATFTFGNFQYTLPTTQTPTQSPLMFGGSNSSTALVASNAIYNLMNVVGSANDDDFTSASTVPAGTGITQAVNQALWVYTSAMGMYNAGQSTTGRYYLGDLTITFNQLVTNPVLQLVGMGATDGSVAIATELQLTTPSLSLSVLSGSPELVVNSGTSIVNGDATPGAVTGSGAASGSVLVTGTNITTMTFQVYLRSVGGTSWTTGPHVGDVWLLGVSTLTSSITPLPLNITNFTAIPQGLTAQLQWNTQTEQNSRFFEVEADRAGKGWQSIGMVMAAGNSNTQKTYNFTDPSPAPGTDTYQIKEVDAEGNVVYSQVASVKFGGNQQTVVFPNPVKDRLSIVANGGTIQSVVISDMGGKVLAQYNGPVAGNSLDMSHWSAGIYLVTIRYASGQAETTKIVKE